MCAANKSFLREGDIFETKQQYQPVLPPTLNNPTRKPFEGKLVGFVCVIALQSYRVRSSQQPVSSLPGPRATHSLVSIRYDAISTNINIRILIHPGKLSAR